MSMNAPSAHNVNSIRALVALIIQRSTIELFAAYGVAIAPVDLSRGKDPERQADHLAGAVQLSAQGRRGVLTLSSSNATLKRVKPTLDDPLSFQDWMREMTNQLAGRIKNKFARYQFHLQVGLPTALKSSVIDQSPDPRAPALIFAFHTLRDDVFVTLTGGFDEAGLILQGEIPVPEEGDVILF
jgi:hypothetical protein